MTKRKKETFKTFVLLFLILSGVIQIGIHWNQQSRGLPFSFVTKIFASDDDFPEMNIETLKSEYFMPDSVVISIDPTSTHWRLGENDPDYKNIWNDIKDFYLPSMIRQRPEKVIPKALWPDITAKRCIRINFSVKWPADIIYWFEDVKPRDLKGFNSIKTIVVMPQDDVNETVNTVYIYDEQQVYQYRVNIGHDSLPKSYYSNLVNKLSASEKPALRLLSSISSSITESSNDILVSVDKGSSSEFSPIRAGIPSSIILNRDNLDNYNVQESILLNQKESLMANYDETAGVASFTDTENLYILNANGVLEYKYIPYIPSSSEQAGESSKALSHALSFIELRRELLGDARLFITNIEDMGSHYEIHFGYKCNGVPIYFSDGSESRFSSPLIVKANEERLLECRWVIRYIDAAKHPQKYRLYFSDLMNKQIPFYYPEIFGKEFERIEEGYVLSMTESEHPVLEPNWIITADSKDYAIPLLKGGE